MIWIAVIVLLVLIWLQGSAIAELKSDLRRLSNHLSDFERRFAGASKDAEPAPTSVVTPSAEVPISTPADVPPIEDPAAPEPATAPSGSWEQRIAKNWLVWLGGVTLALGGAFLVKVSIDYGLLNPTVRVILGIALGIALAASAEVAARREWHAGVGGYAGAALAAAGSSTVFASIYAAYALYDLIGPTITFFGLAGAAVVAAVLSLRHGPVVAVLGIAASYFVPLLVRSSQPDALNLFAYLTAVSGGALLLLRYKRWPWVATLTLAGAGAWSLLWLASGSEPIDHVIIAIFLILHMSLFAAFRNGLTVILHGASKIDDPVARILVRVAFAILAVLLVATVDVDRFSWSTVSWAFVAAVFMLLYAKLNPEMDDLIAIPGLLIAAILALWQLPNSIAVDALIRLDPALVAFMSATIAGIALLSGGGYVGLWLSERKRYWSVLCAAATPVILAICYWKIDGLVSPYVLPIAALAAAAVFSVLVEGLSRQRERTYDANATLAAFSVGVIACTVLACTMVFEEAWLTVALSLHLPALAWIERRLDVPALRNVALAVAAAVIVRLLLNRFVGDYPLSDNLVLNWMLYGYGVPFVAFIYAHKLFSDRGEAFLLHVLESGAIALLFALLTLELRNALEASLMPADRMGFAKDALQATLWLVMGCGQLMRGQRPERVVARISGLVILGLGTYVVVVWLALLENPLLTAQRVGPLPIVNELALAYLFPAIIYGGLAWTGRGPHVAIVTARVLGTSLLILWMSTEIRHAFHEPYLNRGAVSQPELYAYSVAWLLTAVGYVGLGLRRQSMWLRRTGFVGIGLVVLKVFLFDMSSLEGLWRALSFIGLGLALIGIGHAYRRTEIVAPSR